MSAVTDEIIEKLKTLTLLEASELVKQIEETFDVSAAAPVGGMMMAAPVAGGGEEVEEKTSFDVVLDGFGDKKMAVLKVVRTITGLGLKEAKDAVEGVPTVIKEGVNKDEAEEVKKQLEEAGGTVSIK